MDVFKRPHCHSAFIDLSPDFATLCVSYMNAGLAEMDVSGNLLSGEVPAGLMMRLGERLMVQGNPLLQVEEVVSLEAPQFPFYVISRGELMRLERFEIHETALEKGLLTKLECQWSAKLNYFNSGQIRRDCLVFVSHRWLRGSSDTPHPDNEENVKLKHLQRVAALKEEWEFYWIDFVCVPQRNPEQQRLAINSLPSYVKSCSALLTLHGDKIKEEEACLEVYRQRGWCRLEVLSAVVPLVWCSEGGGIKGDAKTELLLSDMHGQECRIESSSTADFERLREQINPLQGKFGDEKDKLRIVSCLEAMCLKLQGSEEHHLQALGEEITSSAEYKQHCARCLRT